eukprot:TRINITY_DN9230_c0_g1_i1.p1 TRINITY_DN9230_c0_g1~~TRINITY_DN9230_c0_g1_i1.p1  ORF type:complete len:564 (-),score=78.63 TRINITY_DN9230_c0_g1_i1:62-1753(-)
MLCFATFALLWRATASELVRGINYGNRFVVEEWMTNGVPKPFGESSEGRSPFFAGLHRAADRFAMADVVDTPTVSAKERMMTWLNQTVKEEHFEKMRARGVNVVRLPCGYWNWVSYLGSATPSAPEFGKDGFPIQQQLKNLQRIASPADYRPHFDRIFEYAHRHDIKVLLDLHAVPGSQNGEMHSGIVTAFKESEAKQDGNQYFNTDWNKQMAVEAIEEMAKFGATKPNLHAIQVINEPHHIDFGFLKDYYEAACGRMRRHLNLNIPCVLFSWAGDLGWWQDHKVDAGKFGTIWYDTHIYKRSSTLQAAISSYWGDYELVRAFDLSVGGILVGEWSLALHSFDQDDDAKAMVAWFVQKMQCFGVGSVYWTYDHGGGAWSFMDNPYQIDWLAVWASRGSVFRPDLAPFSIFTFHGKWLSADHLGGIRSSDKNSQWEQWYAYLYQKDGQQKVALMSWHLKWLTARPDGTLLAEASSHSAWEEFSVYSYESGGRYTMALQSFHGKWVTVSTDGSARADADSHSALEKLTVVYCDKDVWAGGASMRHRGALAILFFLITSVVQVAVL